MNPQELEAPSFEAGPEPSGGESAGGRDPGRRPPAWLRWAQLVRLPAVFSVIAQVVAAFLIAAGGPSQTLAAWPRLVLILLSAVAIYWSGMILNDLWDFAEDSRERPSRPLPSGWIGAAQARAAAWGLCGLSILAALASGLVPVNAARAAVGVGVEPLVAGGPLVAVDQPTTLAPALVAVVLAIAVVLYNGPLKPTALAAPMMGICRALCFLLGAAPLVTLGAAEWLTPQLGFAPHLLAIAAGFGMYITGITTISRLETGFKADGQRDLNVGLAMTLIGAGILAFAPRVAPPDYVWLFRPDLRYAMLVGLITLPILVRGLKVNADPQPAAIQSLIRVGILNLIPYSAALTLLIAGPAWAFGVFALTMAAMLTAIRLRVT